MNIAYIGSFLKNALEQAGHNVIEIKLRPDQDVNEKLRQIKQPVDLVLQELYGGFTSVRGLESCGHELAVWCIDSPINEFWLAEACQLYDHVFVDQLISIENLKNFGVRAEWLPLCCLDCFFVDASEKIFDITFIGCVDKYRLKRQNLIRYLSSYFKINIVSGIWGEKAQKILSQSKITLNENLFPGFTLRILQGMSANSLVATETGSPGVNRYFHDGQTLVEYSPDDVLEKIDYYLRFSSERDEIAASGKLACKREHASSKRVIELLEAISSKKAYNNRKEDRLWHSLCAQYLFTLRFGGRMDAVIQGLEQIFANDSSHSAQAAIRLGDFFAQMNKPVLADKYYHAAMRDNDCKPFVRLAMLWLQMGDAAKAKVYMNLALKRNNAKLGSDYFDIPPTMHDAIAQILYLGARLYFLEGRTFDFGFQKPFEDRMPDTAFGLAQKLWLHNPCPEAMQLMIDSLPSGLTGELLPQFIYGIEKGALSQSQKLRAADVAMKYYDMETADRIIAAFG